MHPIQLIQIGLWIMMSVAVIIVAIAIVWGMRQVVKILRRRNGDNS